MQRMSLMALVALVAITSSIDAKDDERFFKNSQSKSKSFEMPEVELLSHLNKQGRAVYNGLDSESKRLARELAAQAASKARSLSRTDFNSAVETAEEYMAMKRKKLQERRLQNGMDRLK